MHITFADTKMIEDGVRRKGKTKKKRKARIERQGRWRTKIKNQVMIVFFGAV